MAPAPAKLIFATLLCLNVLTWSQGRYGQPATRMRGTELATALFKRSYEGVSPLDGLDDQCRPLSTAPADQCQHVQDHCAASETVLHLNYLQSYYCTNAPLRPLMFTGLLIWLLFLFSTLGISASDFFTPNLASIAQLLGLDENVAGVTFLAFGNGSPDVFSTFSAMRAGSGGLAIGELIGAASFIVSCVVGSMCIIKPFHVHPRPFLRDVGFFALAVSLMIHILWDGAIEPWEAGSMIVLYVVYVLVVVLGSWWERRRERRRAYDELVRSEYQQDQEDVPIYDRYTDNPSEDAELLIVSPPTPSRGRAVSAPAPLRVDTGNLPRQQHPRLAHTRSATPLTLSPSSSLHHAQPQLPSFSLVGALEFRDVVASLRREANSSSLNMFESPVTPFAGGHYHSHAHSRSRHRRRRSSGSTIATVTDTLAGGESTRAHSPASTFDAEADRERGGLRQGLLRLDNSTNGSSDYFGQALAPDSLPMSMHASVPSILRTPASPTVSEGGGGDHEILLHSPPSKRQRILGAVGHVLHTLFPTLYRLREQSVLGAIACVFAAPPVALLTVTLPVVVTHRGEEAGVGVSPEVGKRVPGRNSLNGGREEDESLVGFEEEGVERVLVAEYESVEEDMHHEALVYNKWLMAAQCVFGPVFVVFVLFSGKDALFPYLLLAALLLGLLAATLVVLIGGSGAHYSTKMVRCSMGFLVSIVWIMAIADEVVNVLQAFGVIFGLSDAIIGLTIFAMGNSLADLVANMSVAVFAPIMGFSACFGGPMLNILLGVGITGTLIMQQTHEPYKLALSNTLLVSAFGLLALLVATLVVVPANGYYLSRAWGVGLVAAYVGIMGVNVVVELRGERAA